MRTHGTLTKWNSDRGFGFITLPQSNEELFVHITAFKNKHIPALGTTISFEVEIADGKKRAKNVLVPGQTAPRNRYRQTEQPLSPLILIGSFALLLGIGYFAYGPLKKFYYATHPVQAARIELSEQAKSGTPSSFRCDGRKHCSQMTSCAEAVYFLQNCPNVQMDGNNDGEPCEAQWCN